MSENDIDNVLDLDALAPQPRTIKYGGEHIKVEPPNTKQVLRLSSYGDKMQKVEQLSSEELDQLIADMTNELTGVVPHLKDKNLTTAQLIGLLELVVEMGMPQQAEELKKQGITASAKDDGGEDKKKDQ